MFRPFGTRYQMTDVAIQQGEYQDRHKQEIEWLNDFEPGFTKDRVTLGYALGTSRFYEDKELESGLKKMFSADDFKLEQAKDLIKSSNLPEGVKNKLLDLQ